MNPACIELAERLRLGEWRDREVFTRWLTETPGIESCIHDGLRASVEAGNWRAFELYVLDGLGAPSREYTAVPCAALDRRSDEFNSEDVVWLLDEIADPASVDALERALWWHPEWDEFHALGKKAIHALDRIGTGAARRVIEDAASTGPEEIRDEATAVLARR